MRPELIPITGCGSPNFCGARTMQRFVARGFVRNSALLPESHMGFGATRARAVLLKTETEHLFLGNPRLATVEQTQRAEKATSLTS